MARRLYEPASLTAGLAVAGAAGKAASAIGQGATAKKEGKAQAKAIQAEREALGIQRDRDIRDIRREEEGASAFSRAIMAASGAAGTSSERVLGEAVRTEFGLSAGRRMADFLIEDGILRTKKQNARRIGDAAFRSALFSGLSQFALSAAGPVSGLFPAASSTAPAGMYMGGTATNPLTGLRVGGV